VKRSLLVWGTSAVTLVFMGYAAKAYFPAKSAAQLAIQAATKVAAGHSLASDSTTGSSENADQVSIVGPLAVWIRDANPAESGATANSTWKAQPMDHIVARSPMPEKYLRAEFRLNKFAHFRFILPPHTMNAKLHGNFRSFVRRDGSAADVPFRITLSLMDAQQFEGILRRRATEPCFELQSSNHTIDFALPGVHEQPQEYHLVFSDDAGSGKLFVKANFVVEAE
jgi:hypothetical protein